MNRSPGLLTRLGTAWEQWLTPQATDPAVLFRERIIRGMLPIFVVLLLICFFVSSAMDVVNQSPLWLIIFPTLFLTTLGTFLALRHNRVDLAGGLLVLFQMFCAICVLALIGYWL